MWIQRTKTWAESYTRIGENFPNRGAMPPITAAANEPIFTASTRTCVARRNDALRLMGRLSARE